MVGKDTIAESGGSFYEVLGSGLRPLPFRAGRTEGPRFFCGLPRENHCSKYPNVARSYFDRKGMDVRIIKIEGSVELAPLIGLADGIVDIVETGSTLKENGLEVVETISPISARLIVNVACMKLRKEEIESLIVRMESNLPDAGQKGE